jgi:hypothetical protein
VLLVSRCLLCSGEGSWGTGVTDCGEETLTGFSSAQLDLIAKENEMADKGSTFSQGQQLGNDDYLTSTNGVNRAIMQSDGNFVLYRRLEDGSWTPRWDTFSFGSHGHGPQYAAKIGADDGSFQVWMLPIMSGYFMDHPYSVQYR